MPALRKIYKQGNSLVIAVPAEYAQQMQLISGDYVSFATTPAGELLIKPATRSGPAVLPPGDLPGQIIMPVPPVTLDNGNPHITPKQLQSLTSKVKDVFSRGPDKSNGKGKKHK